MTVTLREATVDDVQAIYELTVALAKFEKKEDKNILITPETIAKDGFGPHKVFDVVLAEVDGVPVGHALYFYTYSASRGERRLYLEDLFVLESHRRRGIGTLLFRWLAVRALERSCSQMKWAVFNWNRVAEVFYERLGAYVDDSFYDLELWPAHMDAAKMRALLAQPVR